MKNKSVEILLASYNGEAYIREQIDSILAQRDKHWHLTVSDDGSTDQTVQILDEYVCRYPDKIVRICSGRKFGNARDHIFLASFSRSRSGVLFYWKNRELIHGFFRLAGMMVLG